MLVPHAGAQVPQGASEQLHQLVLGVLAQRSRELGRVDLLQLDGGPRPTRLEALAQPGGDRVVAGAPVPLAQSGKPA